MENVDVMESSAIASTYHGEDGSDLPSGYQKSYTEVVNTLAHANAENDISNWVFVGKWSLGS